MDLALLGVDLTTVMSRCPDMFCDIKICVVPSLSNHRLGLLATKPL